MSLTALRRFTAVAGRDQVEHQTPGMDEIQSYAGARSALAWLLHTGGRASATPKALVPMKGGSPRSCSSKAKRAAERHAVARVRERRPGARPCAIAPVDHRGGRRFPRRPTAADPSPPPRRSATQRGVTAKPQSHDAGPSSGDRLGRTARSGLLREQRWRALA